MITLTKKESEIIRLWIQAAVKAVEDCPEEGCPHCAGIMTIYNSSQNGVDKVLKITSKMAKKGAK